MHDERLLDTSFLIAVANSEVAALRRLQEHPAWLIPCIAVGELVAGAWRSGRAERNIAWLEEWLQHVLIVPCDAETAWHYGHITALLLDCGTPIPENDAWIASIARQHDLTLVTRDAHFQHVDGLTIEAW